MYPIQSILLNGTQTCSIRSLVSNGPLHQRMIHLRQRKVRMTMKEKAVLFTWRKKNKKKKFSYFLVTSTSPTSLLPLITSSPTTDTSFYSPTNHSMQPFRKNFQCRMCRLTYKVNCSLQGNVRTFDYTFYRIFMIVPHISVKNMKSVMHKQVVTLKNSTRMLHYHHRQLEIINFV